MRFVRSSGGKWTVGEKRASPKDEMAARVWHEKNWMMDLHDSPTAQPSVIHTGQLCFDTQGRLTRMIDRYIEMTSCRCMRFTSVTFAADGKETNREVHYQDAMTGVEEPEPAAGKNLPPVFPFRRVDELPFYSLMKK